MRITLVAIWLLVAVGGAAYHFGPGQKQLVLDDATTLLAQGDRLAASEEYVEAVEKYEAALALMPKERKKDIWRVRLERSKAQMFVSQLPEANSDLKALVDEMVEEGDASEPLLAESRDALANSQYYMTWLMRLEGVGRERWEPEIESARETLKLLAEDAEERGDDKALGRHREDLESTIRLARMELKDLQGLPIPSQ